MTTHTGTLAPSRTQWLWPMGVAHSTCVVVRNWAGTCTPPTAHWSSEPAGRKPVPVTTIEVPPRRSAAPGVTEAVAGCAAAS